MPMVKAPFNGVLNANEIFGSIFNMIISQQVMDPELTNNYSTLVNKYKVDGTLYGDTKLFYAADVLESDEWKADAEAANLLDIYRPDDPKCQAVTLDKFRQICLTVDNYLSKRAWSTEGVFSTFNGIMLGLIGKTKELYETTMFNVYIGTTKGAATRSNETIDLTTALTGLTGEEKNRVEAEVIAEFIANLLVDMKDFSRDFNDYGFMRAYSEGELSFIWNSKYINKINKIDLPTIFHKEGLVDKFSQYVLPARYFGHIATSADAASGGAIEGNAVQAGFNVRAVVEKKYKMPGGTTWKHVFPGELIPAGVTVGGSSASFKYAEVYVEEDDVICKVVTGDTYKFMSAFEVGTNFFNPKALVETHYLTWGYGAPDRLLDQPLVTVSAI